MLRKLLAYGALTVLSLAVVPRVVCGRTESAIFDHDQAETMAFADRIAAEIENVNERNFRTGSSRFDFEWSFGTQQMAALGFAQVMLARPELADRYREPLRKALRKMIAHETLRFGTDAWGVIGIPRAERGHAYLGYANLALGLARIADAGFEHVALHDQVTDSFVKQLEQAKLGLIETYPGESYPVDVASVVASIALHDKCANGSDRRDLVARWQDTVRALYVDPKSGLLVQVASATTGKALDKPRASGTALAAYFLGVADLPLGNELYENTERCCAYTLFGFGAVTEYPSGVSGVGDIDSGPVAFSFGVSPTGFLIGAASQNQDRSRFLSLARTANFFGMPTSSANGWGYQSGGPIGNAIMFAMMTADRTGGRTRRSMTSTLLGARGKR